MPTDKQIRDAQQAIERARMALIEAQQELDAVLRLLDASMPLENDRIIERTRGIIRASIDMPIRDAEIHTNVDPEPKLIVSGEREQLLRDRQ